jgi:hypothetical protein
MSRRANLLLLCLAVAGSGCNYYRSPYYKEGLPPAPRAVSLDEIDHRLFLIGDAGDAKRGKEPALLLLNRRIRELPDRSTVVFLGDNVYERGMPPPPKSEALDEAAEAVNLFFLQVFQSRKTAEEAMDAQIDVVRGTASTAIFIPGNHDWDPLGAGGWHRVLEQQRYIEAAARSGAGADVRMLPGGGCPGPVSVPIGRHGMLITLDTQWFLELEIEHDVPNDKPCEANNPTNCPCITNDQVVAELIAQLKAAAKQRRWAIVTGHHPLNTRGPHGGYAEPLTHLFPMRFMRHYLPWYFEWIPMPVFGTAAVLVRQNFSPSPSDFSNDLNKDLRRLLRGAMADAEKQDAPALLYAAGHDHSLQVFKTPRGPRFNVVSGLGSTSRASEVGATHNTLFAHANGRRPGFMEIDFLKNGTVRLSVVEANPDTEMGQEVFATMIADAKTPRGARPEVKSTTLWRRLGGGLRWIPGLRGDTERRSDERREPQESRK